jgi:hypothetical protein
MSDAFEKLNKKVPGASEQINEAWMKQQIAKSKEFIVTIDPKMVDENTSLGREIKMLKSAKYKFPNKPGADGYWHITK